MNILILSCGTRCKLLQYFKQVSNGFRKVIATDCSPYAPALYVADNYYIVPQMEDVNYIDILLQICEKEKINAILPLQEEELSLISENKYRFEKKGIFVIVSGKDKILLCKDKYALYDVLQKKDVLTIETFLLRENDLENIKNLFPVFVKPRKGAGSIGARKVETVKMLEACIEESKEELIVQPYMEGEEFGVDAYVDFQSQEVVSIFAKKKIRMRAGETEKSVSVIDEMLFDVVKRAIKAVGVLGPIDLDVLKVKGQYYILEINPRFGGGYPHAYECGVNFLEYIVKNIKKKKNECFIGHYEQGNVALKYSDVLIRDRKDFVAICEK